MFESFIRVAKNARKLNRNSILRQVFEDQDIRDDVTNLNKEQMFEQGIDSEGDSLGEYSPATIQIKSEKGQRTDHITLRDTGEFHDSIRVSAERNSFVFRADMVKPDVDLEVIYPKAIGLTNENWDKIKGLIIPEVRRIVLNTLTS